MDRRTSPNVRRCALWLALCLLGLGMAAAGPQEPNIRAQVDGAQPEGVAADREDAVAPAPDDAPSVLEPTDATDAGDAAEAAPGPAAPATQPRSGNAAMPTGAKVAIIRIEDLIYDFTLESLERRVDRALADGASIIVIELDTPGGMVNSALDISKYIKTLPVPTVAWINNDAYSAGIMIASACDDIVMSPASATGDCAPIVPGQELAPTERAKQLSPILEEFRDNAQANGYDYALFHAMCVLGVEVYLIENVQTGERRLVNQADYAVMVQGKRVDQVMNGNGGGLGNLFNFGNSNAAGEVGAPTITLATDADRGQWQLVKQVHDGTTLLTLNQQRALDVGLSDATIATEAELAQHLGAAQTVRVGQTWSEDLAGFLVHPAVRGILVIALLLGAYLEFQSPGLGLPGAVAVLALITLLGAPFLVGLAEIWHILLFFIGFVMLIIELAFVPGFGLLGMGGLLLMLVGLVLSAVPTGGGGGFGPVRLPPAMMWDRVLASTLYLLAGVLVSFVGIFLLTKHFGRLPLFNRLVLANDDAVPGRGAVPLAAPALAPASGNEMLGAGRIQVGDVGRVTTGLRPTGRAEFDGHVVDVVSFGQWIEPGRPVRVVEVHGNRIVVDEARS